jgi:hypothetical protein
MWVTHSWFGLPGRSCDRPDLPWSGFRNCASRSSPITVMASIAERAGGRAAGHRRDRGQNAPGTRSTSSPARKHRSLGWPATGIRIQRSAPGCSSAPVPSSATSPRSSPSSKSAFARSSAACCPTRTEPAYRRASRLPPAYLCRTLPGMWPEAGTQARSAFRCGSVGAQRRSRPHPRPPDSGLGRERAMPTPEGTAVMIALFLITVTVVFQAEIISRTSRSWCSVTRSPCCADTTPARR